MQGEHATIFIIDDEPSVRTALERLCRSAGLAAHSFSSIEEFLQADLSFPDGCVISDIRMPGGSGLSLPHILSQRGLDLPVIFITAYDTPEAREEAKRAGAGAYFRKPIDDHALLDAIAWAVEHPAATL